MLVIKKNNFWLFLFACTIHYNLVVHCRQKYYSFTRLALIFAEYSTGQLMLEENAFVQGMTFCFPKILWQFASALCHSSNKWGTQGLQMPCQRERCEKIVHSQIIALVFDAVCKLQDYVLGKTYFRRPLFRFPKIDIIVTTYFDWTSTRDQNFTPNLSGLLVNLSIVSEFVDC